MNPTPSHAVKRTPLKYLPETNSIFDNDGFLVATVLDDATGEGLVKACNDYDQVRKQRDEFMTHAGNLISMINALNEFGHLPVTMNGWKNLAEKAIAKARGTKNL